MFELAVIAAVIIGGAVAIDIALDREFVARLDLAEREQWDALMATVTDGRADFGSAS